MKKSERNIQNNLKLILEKELKVSEIARNLEISSSLLQKWKREFQDNQQKAFDKGA